MISNYVDNLSVDRHLLQVACFVYELVSLREEVSVQPSNTDLSRDELELMINVICIS
jgi:hypothetical protein